MYANPFLTDYNNTEPYYIPLVKRPKITVASLTSDSELTLSYNRVVTGHDGFTLTATNGPVTLTYVTGDLTTTQVFSLSRAIDPSETVYLSYIPGNVVDLNGNPLKAFTDRLIQEGPSDFHHAYKFNDKRNSMYIGVM